MDALAPTLTVAIAKKPVPVAPGVFAMPSCVTVAPRATMSGPGELVELRSSVFTPGRMAAGSRFLHVKVNWISVAEKVTLGVRLITKDCPPPPGIVAGVFGWPIGTLAAFVC